jgi:hypothetical protein
MPAAEIVEQVTAAGGVLALTACGERIRVELPEDALALLHGLRDHKTEVIRPLREGRCRTHGGRVARLSTAMIMCPMALRRQDDLPGISAAVIAKAKSGNPAAEAQLDMRTRTLRVTWIMVGRRTGTETPPRLVIQTVRRGGRSSAETTGTVPRGYMVSKGGRTRQRLC